MIAKNFKKLALACAFGALAAPAAYAQHDRQVDYDFARVVDSQPIFAEVEVASAERVYWQEPVRYVERGRRHGGGGAVVGGLIGGAIGNQFGKGSGRAAATAAGLLLGASIGNQAERDRHRGYRNYSRREHVRYEEVCERRPQYRREREVVGYDVTYEYNGRVGYTQTDRAPGERIRVRVSVDPVGY